MFEIPALCLRHNQNRSPIVVIGRNKRMDLVIIITDKFNDFIYVFFNKIKVSFHDLLEV